MKLVQSMKSQQNHFQGMVKRRRNAEDKRRAVKRIPKAHQRLRLGVRKKPLLTKMMILKNLKRSDEERKRRSYPKLTQKSRTMQAPSMWWRQELAVIELRERRPRKTRREARNVLMEEIKRR